VGIKLYNKASNHTNKLLSKEVYILSVTTSISFSARIYVMLNVGEVNL
jgi:hypothetical protein